MSKLQPAIHSSRTQVAHELIRPHSGHEHKYLGLKLIPVLLVLLFALLLTARLLLPYYVLHYVNQVLNEDPKL